MKIAFYNVENLFDTLDEPYRNDEDFLPDSHLRWDQKRYVLKIRRLARVISSMEYPMPAFLGLAEVENAKVLADLRTALGLSEDEAGIVHFESPDERGIDVGAIYLRSFMKEIKSTSIKVFFKETPWDRTRDILHIEAMLLKDQKAHFFINHWPSRKEGDKVSQFRRLAASDALLESLGSVYEAEPEPAIIAMGDFNCEPGSAALKKISFNRMNEKTLLQNLGHEAWSKGLGTTTYRRKWLLFDQILASPALLSEQPGLFIDPSSFRIFKEDWMLFYNSKYSEYRPDKTYGGRNYHGGISDHLPVYVEGFFKY
jgi:hypothetical protein